MPELRITSRAQIRALYALLTSLAIWTFVGTLAYSRHYLERPDRGIDLLLLHQYFRYLGCYLPWGLLSPLVLALERRFPLTRTPRIRHLAILAGLSPVFAYAAWVIAITLELGIDAAFDRPPVVVTSPIIPAREMLGHQLLYWSSVIAAVLLRMLLEARENERRAAKLMLEKSQLETSLRQAELDALRMRLRPHFLFNSLQNISVLTEHDPQTGSRMLTKLGELLRASLGRDGRPETTLEAEIELTQAYLAIEQMRFGDRLSTLVDVDPDSRLALVPTFLLQPLVENAIRHGLANVREQGIIVIRSHRDTDTLVLTVTDNGAGPPEDPIPRNLGIGLGATCERLARMYPGTHTFSMRAVPEGGTEVRITLPFRTDVTQEVTARAHAAAADR
ncbi:MAG TPA: sensor histidine kinase [Vicinamibacterales bacterium]